MTECSGIILNSCPRVVLSRRGLKNFSACRSIKSKIIFYVSIRSAFRSLYRLLSRLSIPTAGHVLDQPLFAVKIAPSRVGIYGPHLIRGCLGPPESSSRTASRSVQPLLEGSRSCTDIQTTLQYAGIIHRVTVT